MVSKIYATMANDKTDIAMVEDSSIYMEAVEYCSKSLLSRYILATKR